MKKKLLTMSLVLAMVLSTVGCGRGTHVIEDKPTTIPEQEVEVEVETEVDTEEVEETVSDNTMETVPEEVEGSLSESIVSYFETAIKEYTGNDDELVQYALAIAEECEIPLELTAMSIEEGLLPGFGNTEIKGFETGIQFAPMIGSIPFIGFMFDLSDDVVVDDFIATLTDNADLRWNVCTAADVMTYTEENGVVLFVMHPTMFVDEPVTNEEEEVVVGEPSVYMVSSYDGLLSALSSKHEHLVFAEDYADTEEMEIAPVVIDYPVNINGNSVVVDYGFDIVSGEVTISNLWINGNKTENLINVAEDCYAAIRVRNIDDDKVFVSSNNITVDVQDTDTCGVYLQDGSNVEVILNDFYITKGYGVHTGNDVVGVVRDNLITAPHCLVVDAMSCPSVAIADNTVISNDASIVNTDKELFGENADTELSMFLVGVLDNNVFETFDGFKYDDAHDVFMTGSGEDAIYFNVADGVLVSK